MSCLKQPGQAKFHVTRKGNSASLIPVVFQNFLSYLTGSLQETCWNYCFFKPGLSPWLPLLWRPFHGSETRVGSFSQQTFLTSSRVGKPPSCPPSHMYTSQSLWRPRETKQASTLPHVNFHFHPVASGLAILSALLSLS